MTKKINEGGGTLISPEFKAVIHRLKRKEPELDAVAKRSHKRKRRARPRGK